jgi:hypothetical protein
MRPDGNSRALAPARAGARWLSRNRLALSLGALAAVPVILSTVREAGKVVPVGDRAMIALRAYDVLSAHPPLVGHYSSSSSLLAEDTYGLGPMLYWLLALPSHVGPLALTVTIGLVNIAAVMGIVALALRRGGPVFAVLVSAAVVVMCSSLFGSIYSDIWNPSAGLLPLTLLMFVTWSLAVGEYRLLPLAVLLASFVAQCHLAFVPPAVGLMAVGLVGLVLARRETSRRARPEGAEDRPGRAEEARSVRRWVIAACVVGLVCWSAPLVEQATHRPGNIVALARTAAAGEPTLGLNAGWNALVRTVGVPPWWMHVPHSATERFVDVSTPLGAARTASAVLILAALVMVTVLGVRRRRRDVAAAGVQGLVLCAAIAIVAGSTPTAGLLGLSIGYTLWWGSPAGMWVWLALAWSGAVLWSGAGRPLPARRPALVALAVLGTAAAVSFQVRAGAGENASSRTYEPMRTIAQRLDRAVPPSTKVLVESSHGGPTFDAEFDFEMGSAYALRRHGADVLSRDWKGIGASYELDGHTPDEIVRVSLDRAPVAEGGKVIAALPLEPIPGTRQVRDRFVTVTLLRPNGKPASSG